MIIVKTYRRQKYKKQAAEMPQGKLSFAYMNKTRNKSDLGH